MDPAWKYRGLYIVGMDSQNRTVGSFRFPNEDDPMFWDPPRCPGGAIHTNADPKPYEVEILYATPPAGTGTIHFAALFKTGPANVGEFYYPNGPHGDLTLMELGGAKENVELSNVGESCNDACSAIDKICDANAMAGMNGEQVRVTTVSN